MSKYEINELITNEKIHLKYLITNNGTKTLYDAVSQCSRCGYCETSCPTYTIEKRETLSPRGRNQIVKQLIEGKFKDGPNAAYESLKTCLLCGACSSTCYGKVATPDIVLEARRETSGYGQSIIYKLVIWLIDRKKIFDIILKSLYILKKSGLAYISEKLGLFYFLGMPSINDAHKKLLNTPLKFLHEKLSNIENHPDEDIKWIYFASCGIDYIFTNVGEATINILTKIYGNGIFMKNECCGLISYNYGSIEDAKKLAIKNIELFENFSIKYKNFKMIVDCSSCAAFLKNYPQLFADDEVLFKRANEFSKKIYDITELLKPEYFENKINNEKSKNLKVTIHHSCRACHGQGILKEPESVLKYIFGENFIQMPESDMCCGGAGAFSFTNPELYEKILLRKIKNISSVQPDIVVVSSTSCIMQIGYGLKEIYPTAKVIHYSQLINEVIK